MSPALPPSASVVQAGQGVKLVAPSAERNVEALTALLVANAPRSGHALEIASGTGQHISAFAAALPDLQWQPSEIDSARRSSIDAYVSEADLPNVATAIPLDGAQPKWHGDHDPKELILNINLLHLVPDESARVLITEASSALTPSGMLILYGPFKRNGVLISDGDKRFDRELRNADPAIGYKDDLDIRHWLGDAGLTLVDTIEMPANNLAFIARKPAP